MPRWLNSIRERSCQDVQQELRDQHTTELTRGLVGRLGIDLPLAQPTSRGENLCQETSFWGASSITGLSQSGCSDLPTSESIRNLVHRERVAANNMYRAMYGGSMYSEEAFMDAMVGSWSRNPIFHRDSLPRHILSEIKDFLKSTETFGCKIVVTEQAVESDSPDFAKFLLEKLFMLKYDASLGLFNVEYVKCQ